MMQIEGNIPSISGLATTAALTAIENNIPDISNQFKKTDYDAKTSDIESKHFTTADYNKFTSQRVDANIRQKELVDKSAITKFTNNVDLNKKVATLAIKAELTAEQDKLINLQALDSSYFRGKINFEDGATQSY